MRRTYLIAYIVLYALSIAALLWRHATRLADFRYGIAGLILIGLLYYSEALAHKRRLANWEEIRSQGKTRFLLLEYVALRGGTVSLLILMLLSTKVTIGPILLASVVPLLAAMVFVGNEEWKSCESQFVISTLRSTGENIKALNN